MQKYREDKKEKKNDERYKMRTVRSVADHVFEYIRTVFKWLVVATVTGLVGGAVGSLFHHGVDYATQLRMLCPWLLYLLPAAGVLITAFYRWMHTQGIGTNAVIDAVHQGYDIPIRLIPAIFFGTILTHLCGGSAGREGAALQIGGDLGEHIARMFRLDDKDMRLGTLCGMSALFSALFGTPLAATFFSLEVISVGVLYYAGFIPCITSALVAYWLSLRMGVAPMRFAVSAPELSAGILIRTAGLAVLAALVSILFCEVLHRTEKGVEKLTENRYLRAVLGGCVIIALTLVLGCRDYNGAGIDVINAAVAGEAKPLAFLWKILFTAITLSCGFKGGEVVPTLFIGATFGCTAGALLGLPAPFAAAVGMVCLFCSAVNCPIASIILSVELFGAEGILCFAVACAVSYVLSGYRGLYSSQTILYSKLRAEFINVHTK